MVYVLLVTIVLSSPHQLSSGKWIKPFQLVANDSQHATAAACQIKRARVLAAHYPNNPPQLRVDAQCVPAAPTKE